jgi:hypothetical protein
MICQIKFIYFGAKQKAFAISRISALRLGKSKANKYLNRINWWKT